MRICKVVICIGIPASGKSTWAKQFIKNNPNFIRVNRDDIRYQIKDSPVLDFKGEEYVTSIQTAMIDSALMSGYSVIVDNTNLRKEYIDAILEQVKYKADVEFKVFLLPLEEAILRDSKRENPVGEKVINKMFQTFTSLHYNIPNDYFSPRRKLTKIYEENKSTLKKAVVFDLDGNLCHMNGKRGPFDYEKIYLDDVDLVVREHVWFQKQSGKIIIMVSGRDDSCYEETLEWLNHHMIPCDFLFMRNTGDQRKDYIVKEDIYNIHIKNNFNVVVVYDDRSSVVKKWRELGLKCFQTNPGDF